MSDFPSSVTDVAPDQACPQPTSRGPTVALFGITIDRLTGDEAADRVLAWVVEAEDTSSRREDVPGLGNIALENSGLGNSTLGNHGPGISLSNDRTPDGPSRPRRSSPTSGAVPCRVVVTPNVDHLVLLTHHEGLQAVYAHADLVVADGAPVVWASRVLGAALPERVSGADLVPAIFDRAASWFGVPSARKPASGRSSEPGRLNRPLRVFLMGAGPGVGDRAAAAIESTWPHVAVVGVESPPVGFQNRPAENERLLAAIEAARPDLLLVGLGAPKQELWIEAHRERLATVAALGIGATIDFLAGEKPRAPVWMRRTGLEWVHRLASEPKRLARRYATDAVIFPRLVWAEWRKRRTRR